MRWSEFAADQRVLAAVGSDQLIKPGVVLIGTTRKDGSARISAVEPLLMDGELWLSMMPASAKARDLYRDPRIVVHSIVTNPSPEAEIMMRGTAWRETAPDVHRAYAAAAGAQLGWRPVPAEFALFSVDISDVTFIGHDAGSNAQHVARWPAGEEYLRPSLTPTSLGPPQPVRRLLAQQAEERHNKHDRLFTPGGMTVRWRAARSRGYAALRSRYGWPCGSEVAFSPGQGHTRLPRSSATGCLRA